MLFGFMWFSSFMVNKAHFVCYVSAATFYFSSGPQKTGEGQVMLGVRWGATKHFGSLALGALIHTIIAMLRNMAEQNQRNSQGGAAAVVACIAACCARCLEDLVEYLNKIAFAYQAITGETYCKSAWNAMLLNLKHLWKFYFA
jgi:hypothetical protein